jgi:hypothetical protein
MKKIFFAAVQGIFLVSVIGINGYGQNTKSNSNIDGEGTVFSEKADMKINRFAYINNINIRAIRDFQMSYKKVSNEKWNITEYGFSVNFTMEDIRYNIRYDKKGNHLFTLKNYTEKHLAKNIRSIIKSVYYDYNIKWVEEIVKSFNDPVFLVLLENEKEWLRIRVIDGEMSIWEKIDK